MSHRNIFIIITILACFPTLSYSSLGDKTLLYLENLTQEQVPPGTPEFTYTELTPEQQVYLEQLIQISREQKLYKERYWFKLLHYTKTITGVRSEVKGKYFFTAPDGHKNPEHELEYTLRSIFQGDLNRYPYYPHPRCIFQRRYSWLSEKLQIDEKRLPDVKCPQFDSWIKNLDVDSISIVFASFYMGNPASMFGHTFIKLNKSKHEKDFEILDYGINFSAQVTREQLRNPLNSLMGLTGIYPGKYDIFPYYLKTNEYNNIDNRDLWEYRLNFSRKEIRNIMEHLWELNISYYPYYFFKKNCSYQILNLLEIANEPLELTRHFSISAIPTDTLLILQKKGLIESEKARLSNRSKLIQHLSVLTGKQNRVLNKLLTNDKVNIEDLTLSAKEKVLLLDSALHLVSYKSSLTKNKKKSKDLQQIYNQLLLDRSRLKAEQPEFNLPHYLTSPITGHYSSKIGFNYIYNTQLQNGLYQLEYRPAYHSLIEPWKGFSPFSAIEFMTTRISYQQFYPETIKNFKLSQIKIIHITALSPIHHRLPSRSFDIETGFAATENMDDRKMFFYLNYSLGGAFQPFPKGFMQNTIVFLLPQLRLQAGKRFNKFIQGGPGLNGGVLARFGHFCSLLIQGQGYLLYDGTNTTKYASVIGQLNLSFTRWLSITSGIEYDIFSSSSSVSGEINFYFRN